MANHKKKATMAGISALVAATVGIGGIALSSGALFTSEAAQSESVKTAIVTVSAATATDSAAINLTSMLPGDTATTKITVTNTGNEAVLWDVAIPNTAAPSNALADQLKVSVNVGSTTLEKTLTDWQAGSLKFKTPLAAGATETITVTTSLPTSATNAVQNLSAKFDVKVNAQQSRNVTPPTADGFVNF